MPVPKMTLSSPSVITTSAIGIGAAYYLYSTRSNHDVHQIKQRGIQRTFPSVAFVNLTLEEITQVNHDSKLLRFRLPANNTQSGLPPISSLITRHWVAGAWFPTFRPYSPVSSNDEQGTISLLVKQYPNGRASSHLNNMQPGQTLAVKAFQEFSYTPNTYSRMYLVAGGAGITPMAQLINTVLHNPADKTKLNLLYANRTEQDILLKSELDELQGMFPERFRVEYVVGDAPTDSQTESPGQRITRDFLQKVLPEPNAEQDKPIKVMVCGPSSMIAAIAGKKGPAPWMQGRIGGYLEELGWRADQVHKF